MKLSEVSLAKHKLNFNHLCHSSSVISKANSVIYGQLYNLCSGAAVSTLKVLDVLWPEKI